MILIPKDLTQLSWTAYLNDPPALQLNRQHLKQHLKNPKSHDDYQKLLQMNLDFKVLYQIQITLQLKTIMLSQMQMLQINNLSITEAQMHNQLLKRWPQEIDVLKQKLPNNCQSLLDQLLYLIQNDDMVTNVPQLSMWQQVTQHALHLSQPVNLKEIRDLNNHEINDVIKNAKHQIQIANLPIIVPHVVYGPLVFLKFNQVYNCWQHMVMRRIATNYQKHSVLDADSNLLTLIQTQIHS